MRQMRQLPHQNNHNSAEIETGFANISYDNLQH